MRILISTPWLGGIGGVERNVACTIRALADDHVDVCARHVIRSEYLVRPQHGKVWHPARWLRPHDKRKILSRVWPPVHQLLRPRQPPYDLYLQYAYGRDVRDRFSARCSMLRTSGKDVRDVETTYDYVALDAPGNSSLIGAGANPVLLPPPLEPMAASSIAVTGLPSRYFLTVFNSHASSKGGDILARHARRLPLPVVWCWSGRWGRRNDIPSVDNLIPLESVSQGQLRFLYEHCAAYVSFSRSESFGWAIADALQYGAPVFSRQVGILTYPDLDLRGVHVYSSESELVDLVATPPEEKYQRDLAQLSPGMFRCRLHELLATTAG